MHSTFTLAGPGSRVIVLGDCNDALVAGYSVAPEAKVGMNVRIFTSKKTWVPATISEVTSAKITVQVGGSAYDIELPHMSHYIDLRDPAQFPEPLNHPFKLGYRLGAAVLVFHENRWLRLYVTRIDIYSGRIFAQFSLPKDMQVPGRRYDFDPGAPAMTAAGMGYSIPMTYPKMQLDTGLDPHGDSW